MTEKQSSETGRFSRRSVLKGSGALLGAAVFAGGRAAAATPTRDSYQILEGTEFETTVHVYDSDVDGITTFVVGGMHGDEPSGYQAAGHVSNWRVQSGRLVVVPRANVPAIENGDRNYGFDLNRQFPPNDGDCTTGVARAIWKEVERYDPDLVFDLHSSKGVYHGDPSGVGQAMFPTWTDPAREVGGRVVGKINDRFDLPDDIAYRMGNTLDADSPKLLHRVAGVLDRPGYICETYRGPALDQQVKFHLWAVRWGMEEFGQLRGPPEDAVKSVTDLPEPMAFAAHTHTLTDAWQEFETGHHFRHPVVVAPSMQARGWHQSHPRVDDYTNTSYRARVEEWEYLDGEHVEERAGVVVTETGHHTTDDGSPFEADRVWVDHDWEWIEFAEPFDDKPAVFAHPMTAEGSASVVARVRTVTTEGFELRLQEEEASDDEHTEEYVGWFALEPGRGQIDGRAYEAGYRIDDLDHHWLDVSFDGSYDDPVFVADVMSMVGPDPAAVRYEDLSSDGVRVFLEEEASANDELTHTDEDLAYFVVEG